MMSKRFTEKMGVSPPCFKGEETEAEEAGGTSLYSLLFLVEELGLQTDSISQSSELPLKLLWNKIMMLVITVFWSENVVVMDCISYTIILCNFPNIYK